MTKEKLIRLFMFDGPPYILLYQYRTNSGKALHKQDLPILKEMIKEGTVRMVEKTTKTMRYVYNPKA
jgi:hypothetical protein